MNISHKSQDQLMSILYDAIILSYDIENKDDQKRLASLLVNAEDIVRKLNK
jgi:hypothetical protein